MFLRFDTSSAAEARGGGARAAYSGCSSNKLEQVESYVLVAAGAEARICKGFHAEKSPKRNANRIG
jgi:hypothetical protein